MSINQWSTTSHIMLRMQISTYFRHLLSGVWKSWHNSRNTLNRRHRTADLLEIVGGMQHSWSSSVQAKVIRKPGSNCRNSNNSETSLHILDIFCDFLKEVINRLRFVHKALADIEILQNSTWRLISFADNHRHFLKQHRCRKCRWIAVKTRHNWKLKFVFLKPRYL